jgi:glycosyltransferase involved in cell wall biosynthesis
MTTLTIVIPAYNEENGIADISQRVLAVRPALEAAGVREMELLVVDDGSRDATREIAAGISGVRLICHPQNRGYGAALKTGFGHASGDLIGFLDADGTYPPEYFPQLCAKAMNGSELVIGSRMAGADSEMPFTRRLGNRFFATLLSLLARQKVSDSASGMRVFRRDILERIYPLPDGLNLTPVMSTRAIHEGVKISEIPIPYSERVGRSKLSIFRDGSLFLRSMVWTALTYNPVRILGFLGLALLIFAGIIALTVVLARLQGQTVLTPTQVALLFTGAVAAFAGVSLFSLGITFNYLISLFYKRPIRQGLFGRPLLKTPLDAHFWWLGGLACIIGLIAGAISIGLGIAGMEVSRLWFYWLNSAMLVLIGMQLLIYWIILRVLDELSDREARTARELAVALPD